MSRVLKRVEHEFLKLLPAFLFFSVAFSIVVTADALYVRGSRMHGFRIVGAIVLALIVSKAILVANMLPFVDAFRNRPLVYNTVWKTCLYTVVALWTYFTERTIRLAAMDAHLTRPDPQLMHPFPWTRFWVVMIWLLVSFFIFVSYAELDRKLGRGRLRRLFFKREEIGDLDAPTRATPD